MEYDEVTESNAKNLLLIPSECEVTSEDKREYDDFEDIEYVEATLPDPEIVSIEEENSVEKENVVQREEEDVDLEDISQIQDMFSREYYPTKYYSMGHGSAHGSGYGSAPVNDDKKDDSPVEGVSPVKPNKPPRRALKAKNNDPKAPPKDWTVDEEIALCQALCDLSGNSERGNSMKTKGIGEAVINYFTKEIANHESGSNDLDVYQKACAKYKMMYMHEFTLEHCYNILKDHQDWLEIEMPSFYKNTKWRKKEQWVVNLNNEADESEEEIQEKRAMSPDKFLNIKKKKIGKEGGATTVLYPVEELGVGYPGDGA
nr:hypothetical protein [Tanacetum cinerariifolium]